MPGLCIFMGAGLISRHKMQETMIELFCIYVAAGMARGVLWSK